MNKTMYMLVNRNATMKSRNGVSCPLEYRYHTIIESHGNVYDHGYDVVYEDELLGMSTSKLAEYDIYVVLVIGDIVASRRGVFKTNKVEIIRKLYERDRNQMFRMNDSRIYEKHHRRYSYVMETIGEAVVMGAATMVLKKLIK